jgi:hypothetical protein
MFSALTPAKIKETFKEYFGEEKIELSQFIEIGKVYTLDLVGSGWTIKYSLNKLQAEYFLDFFAYHRMTNSRHNRIHENGMITNLENYWEFGDSIYENDSERTEKEKQEIIKKNHSVYEILKSKGFEN